MRHICRLIDSIYFAVSKERKSPRKRKIPVRATLYSSMYTLPSCSRLENLFNKNNAKRSLNSFTFHTRKDLPLNEVDPRRWRDSAS